MRMKLAITLAVSALACQSPLPAQTPEAEAFAAELELFRERLQQLYESAERDSAEIPFAAKMDAFFVRARAVGFESPELELTDADVDRLAAFAQRHAMRGREFANRLEARMLELCEELEDASLAGIDPTRWVAEIDALERRHEAAESERYEQLLRSLTPPARATLERYVDERMAGGSSVDMTDLWPEFPRVGASMIAGRCRRDEMPERVIVSSSFSSSGTPGARLASFTSLSPPQSASEEAAARARLEFGRIVPPDELVALLEGRAVELESLFYRNVGRGSGRFTFASGTAAAVAIAAAEERVVIEKLARAYASQAGVEAVRVPGNPISGGRRVVGPQLGLPDRASWDSALEPTRAELDAMTLPPCPVDERVVEPFGEADPLVEAACGFRPYAIVVRGEPDALERLTEAADAQLQAAEPTGDTFELRPSGG